jgi:hypothetical protein
VIKPRPTSSLCQVPGSPLKVGKAMEPRMRRVAIGARLSDGAATLGMTGPDPEKLSAEEALRCFGVVQGAR